MESLDQLEVSTTAESFPTTLLAGQLSAFAHRWVPVVCQGHPDFYRRELVDVELLPRCAKPLQSHLHH